MTRVMHLTAHCDVDHRFPLDHGSKLMVMVSLCLGMIAICSTS
jgi:hypothetical protein